MGWATDTISIVSCTATLMYNDFAKNCLYYLIGLFCIPNTVHILYILD